MKKKRELSGIVLETELKSIKVRVFHTIINIIVAIVGIVVLFPILWIFLSAFKDTKEFLQVPPTIIPKSFHPEYIPIVWKKSNFANAYINTLMLMIGCCTCGIFFNGIAGYVIALLKPKGIKIVSTLIFWTMMIPGVVSTVPLFMTFVDFPILHINLVNTYVPMYLMAGAECFTLLLFKAFFSGLPREYLEAARIDGCSELGMFFKIVMPLSKPIVMTVGVFSMTGAINNFYWPYLLINDPTKETVALKLFSLKSIFTQNEYMVALIFVLIPTAMIFILFQKYIMQGANVGGIKG